ncbi:MULTISPECIES: hypothetical protein [Brevibacillus]|uniref:GlsB/YeaQ/YmgE family stress response membrane protein n=2 Tax=Brevibacillus TaxID=55080 RepID=A0A517IB51_BREBE|nr:MULTISPECIES: hypothetical protein [Brevibacillus]MDC0761028.1 hypothetical protein [Brevibacillus sp. AG]MED1797402.1 hypothetical protein [Brevibacillus porteri]MED2129472.1 hypothetical protein [Brevibacillus porteri]MED2743573.1 hypothetical protein [Brevibacillus porteri]MED2817985.1 hypothetical protein [Brevibacillus porteri]
MFWFVWAVVGVVVWWAMSRICSGKAAGSGWWASLIAALLGSWLGDLVLGDWLWMWAGFNVIAGVIGAVVVTWLWCLVVKQLK